MNKMSKGRLLSAAVGVIGFMALLLLVPKSSRAFNEVDYGAQNQSSISVYGFLRNNTGMFLDTQPYQENGNQLATERTWLRTYVDWRPSDKLKLWANIQFAYEPDYDVENGFENNPSYLGKPVSTQYSEYDDVNDVLREFYLEWTPNSATDIKMGRQIAIWGESLTDQVGDVINPIDQRDAMAFTNWEDSRVPQWMIRSIHDLSSLNSSFEWIVSPLLTSDAYRVNRDAGYAQEAFPSDAAPYWTPGQRFGMYPEDRPNVITPTNTGNYGLEIPSGFAEQFPDTWNDMRYGFRTATYAGGYHFGLMYWHTQSYEPLLKRGEVVGFIPFLNKNIRSYSLVHPSYDIYGAYMDKQLPWPGVIRAEAIYSPNKPFNTFDPTDADALVKRNYVKYEIGYDLNNYLYYQWHNTAPFDLTIEHVGEWVQDNKGLAYIIYATEQPSYVARFNGRLSTNWFYDRLEGELIVSYWPWQHSGLIMPDITWKPGWMKQQNLSIQLKYINVYGDSHYAGLGFLDTKDMVVLTTEFDF